jgi:uncharacterized membrane protein
MNKMLVAVFDTEAAAFEGLSALKDLHREGDITLYATAVIAKDAAGTVSVKKQAERGTVGGALGLLTGSLLGLMAGPVGVAVGAYTGGLTGLSFDLVRFGIGADFLDEMSQALTPGKVALLAEVEETWVTPVDTRLGKLGAVVFRRGRSEVVEDQLAREAAALEAELKQLQEELAQASADAMRKAAVQEKIEAVKHKLEAKRDQAEARQEQATSEVAAKIDTLRVQTQQVSDQQKAKTDKRIAEITVDYEARRAKLDQAQKLIKEALSA